MSQLNELNIKPIMMKLISTLPNEVGVFLSSGIDSRCIVFALLESGRTVHTYSFTLNDRQSRDCYVAEEISKKFDLKFTKIELPTDLNILKTDIITLHKKYGCIKKTEYECTWPFIYSYPKVEETVIANGIRADIHFGDFKRARIHFKNNLDEFRKEVFNEINGGQELQHLQLAKEYNKQLFEPYRDKSMIDYFMGTTYEQCNTPHKKQPILNAFPELFNEYRIFPHANFQSGDSGIADLFDKLLDTDWNIHNYKSVSGIFNSINRGELPNGKQRLI